MNLMSALKAVNLDDLVRVRGAVVRVIGVIVEAEGLSLPVGAECTIVTRDGERVVAEVVGFDEGRTHLLPEDGSDGIAPRDEVIHDGEIPCVAVSQHLLGRVVNARGVPIDGLGPLPIRDKMPISSDPIPALKRQKIRKPVHTGIRALDSILTVGLGQRLGIFSGSGVGKSTLLGMIARNTEIPVRVIALVGERGREVREFIERDLGPQGLARSVVVVATGDEAAVMRLRAARVATSIAEWFRDRGEDVLLLVDSITRVALAQREVGLCAGEPPTTRGYTPSVFAMLPRLLERTGPGVNGSITAFYSVLVEGDDQHDPIGDAVRGILDGQVWLSRDLANKGWFPPIDPCSSISRSMKSVVDEEHFEAARSLVEKVAIHSEIEDMVRLGAYVKGHDLRSDEAIDAIPLIEKLLRQEPEVASDFFETRNRLIEIARGSHRKAK
ncbi:MAG: FliI/YscN family ATPase [Planctomycetota bacterium]|nr:FliI/YscN family ATPase [Planctomycetota bacterium]